MSQIAFTPYHAEALGNIEYPFTSFDPNSSHKSMILAPVNSDTIKKAKQTEIKAHSCGFLPFTMTFMLEHF
jgi:hypothetical protein